MFILKFVGLFIIYIVHLFIPFNYIFFNSLELHFPYKGLLIIYIVGIIFFIRLLSKINKVDYDILFLVIIQWLSNVFGYIYFNNFRSLILSFFCLFISFFSILFLINYIKKINNSYPRYVIILLGFYFYLLIVLLFKFI